LFRESYGESHPEPELSPYLARTFDPVRVRAELATADYRAWFAVDADQQPIGYAVLRRSEAPFPAGLPGSRPAEVLRFYVDATWHGHGVGFALMRACESEARGWGADCMWASVWRHATGPIAFYQRTGLTISGTAKFRFGDREEDDHVMSKALT
jgi:GNAT superfamily N-acetyltransferase